MWACRALGSTVEISLSGATRRAMRHRPMPSKSSGGSTSCPTNNAGSDCRGRLGPEFGLGHVVQQPVRIGDQRVHQLRTDDGVVQGDRAIARIGVVMPSALLDVHLGGTGHVTADSTDRADQLGHRVLGGHRVSERRGIQRPPRIILISATTCLADSKIRFGRWQLTGAVAS